MYSNFILYAEALKALIKQAFTNGDVILEPVDTAFQYATKETENNLKFPFISFYMNPSIQIDSNSFPSYNEGKTFENPMTLYNDDGSSKGTTNRLAKKVKHLYIIIGYEIEVWGTTRLDTEELMQELLFWLYENQTIKSEYMGVELSFTFEVDNQIIDNSDLVSYMSQR